jgi:hypothetical protein
MAKGEKQIKYTEEQRAEIVERICLLYESQNATIASCCQACGITDRTFLLWVAADSALSERYKKAKSVQDDNYWESIIKPLAKTALQKHLEVEYADKDVDVVYQGVPVKDKEGNPAKQRTREFVLPNPTLTIFAMKGVFPKRFVERLEHSNDPDNPLPDPSINIVVNAPNVQPVTSEEAMQAILDKFKTD